MNNGCQINLVMDLMVLKERDLMFRWFAKARHSIKSNGMRCSILSLRDYKMSKVIKYLGQLDNLLMLKVL